MTNLHTAAASAVITAILMGCLGLYVSPAEAESGVEVQAALPPQSQTVKVIPGLDYIEEDEYVEDTIIYDEVSLKLEQEMERVAYERDGRFYFPERLREDTFEYFYNEELPLSYDVQEAVFNACVTYNLDLYLVYAVIWQETDWQNMITPGDGVGYMQVIEKWHRDRMARVGATDLMNPADNIMTGCDYLAHNINTYGLEKGLGVYNTGSPIVNRYAKSVIERYNKLWEGDYNE